MWMHASGLRYYLLHSLPIALFRIHDDAPHLPKCILNAGINIVGELAVRRHQQCLNRLHPANHRAAAIMSHPLSAPHFPQSRSSEGHGLRDQDQCIASQLSR